MSQNLLGFYHPDNHDDHMHPKREILHKAVDEHAKSSM